MHGLIFRLIMPDESRPPEQRLLGDSHFLTIVHESGGRWEAAAAGGLILLCVACEFPSLWTLNVDSV